MIPLLYSCLEWLLFAQPRKPRAQNCQGCAAPEGLGLDSLSTGLNSKGTQQTQHSQNQKVDAEDVCNLLRASQVSMRGRRWREVR